MSDGTFGRSTFRPNDPFDPRNIIGHFGVDAWRVPIAAIFPERRYTDLTRHTCVIGVVYLKRAAGIALVTYYNLYYKFITHISYCKENLSNQSSINYYYRLLTVHVSLPLLMSPAHIMLSSIIPKFILGLDLCG